MTTCGHDCSKSWCEQIGLATRIAACSLARSCGNIAGLMSGKKMARREVLRLLMLLRAARGSSFRGHCPRLADRNFAGNRAGESSLRDDFTQQHRRNRQGQRRQDAVFRQPEPRRLPRITTPSRSIPSQGHGARSTPPASSCCSPGRSRQRHRGRAREVRRRQEQNVSAGRRRQGTQGQESPK